jgi:DDE family transposase
MLRPKTQVFQTRRSWANGEPEGRSRSEPPILLLRVSSARRHGRPRGSRRRGRSDGLPLGYTLVPASEREYEPLADLLSGVGAKVVIADKGLLGRNYQTRLAADGVRLLNPDRTRTAENLGRERALASLRLMIESVFATSKDRCGSSITSPKHPPGSPHESRSASWRSHSACCSTPSPDDQHAPSPPTTAAKSHRSL